MEHVRENVWETGVGSDMFVERDDFWSLIRAQAREQHLSSRYVASVLRTDVCDVNSMTLGEAKRLRRRPKSERLTYMRTFAAALKRQLEEHGDSRLSDPESIAVTFSKPRLQEIENYERDGGDPIESILRLSGIPANSIHDKLTIGEIGELAAYVRQLAILSEQLVPRMPITARDVPLETLPSLILEKRIAACQRKVTRVSGSNLGDAQIAPLLLYADAVELDKRTLEYLRQVKRSLPSLSGLMRRSFRAPDYSQLPELVNSVEPT